MMEICPQELCTGCQACRMICNFQAIRMIEDKKGNIYPIIDDDKCVQCNKCSKICPSLHPVSCGYEVPIIIAGWIKDKKRRLISTSGGLSDILAQHVIGNNGVFCGVVWSSPGAKHQFCNKISALTPFQGSKYTHSDVENTYIEIKHYLTEGKSVLFTGTPCQIAGLRSFLQKDYNNLYTVDLVCHGVPSRKFLQDCIKEVEKKHQSKVINIRFREKNPDQYHTCLNYHLANGKIESEKYTESFFARSFVDNFILRDISVQ